MNRLNRFESRGVQLPLFRECLFGPSKGFCPLGLSLVTRSYHCDMMKESLERAPSKSAAKIDRRSAVLGWGLLSSLFVETPAIAGSLFDESIDLIVGIYIKDGENRVVSSGFKWGADHIVTSYVAIHDALKKNLNFMTRDRYDNPYDLEVHGYDPSLDIVVLKYSGSSGKAVQLKLDGRPKVGQSAYVLGKNGDGSAWMGSGIISATEREIQAVNGIKMQHLLQTDVPINPEAGGAGIFDSNGLLLGMLTSGNVPFKTLNHDSGVHFVVAASTLYQTVPALISYKNSKGKL